MSDPSAPPRRAPVPSVPEGYAGGTPMLRQYFATRAEHPGVVLLMRVGDFFEAYGDDAELIARELDITLTGREDGGVRVPMAGVPHHASERYVARLVAKGRRVALMDQVEDPRHARGLVKRRVTRVVTPGTVLEDAMLQSSSNNYLVAAIVGDPVTGLGVVDISTGEFLATEIDGLRQEDQLLEEITRLEPAEVLLSSACPPDLREAIESRSNATVTVVDTEGRSGRETGSREMLLTHFATQSLRGFGCDDYSAGLDACALVLRYLKSTQEAALTHIRSLSTYSTRTFMTLDSAARRHLELTVSLGDGSRQRTLLSTLDETLTPMGGRLLRRWVEEPLLDVTAIRARQDGVEALASAYLRRGDVRDALRGMGDVERLVSRCSAGLANARDLVGLKEALDRLPVVAGHLEGVEVTAIAGIRGRLAVSPSVARVIEQAIAPDPPAGFREGGLIRPGFNAELDRLRQVSGEAKSWIASLETSERERTGINTLKVGYNAVFGYYVEITRANVPRVPPDYIRKQTTASGERYITPQLKEYEAQVLGAEEKAVELEYELFLGVRERVSESSAEVLATARAVAELDVLASLGETAAHHRYVRPTIDDGDAIDIAGGRHPVIERLGIGGPYIANDCRLDSACRMVVITGPNMSGKSSFLRQTALIVLLAQIGSFVPADSAVIGIVDRIFTRVGAHDELASGQSTFMVEMNETANILNNATSRSLVVLDEIGRGTSTYDGLSIAWAVAEHLVQAGARTLFATHYHYLNELASHYPVVQNYRVAVKEQGDRILWLRKLVPGGTDKSYGIQVARMAGVPPEVIRRAQEVLKSLEKSRPDAARAIFSPQAPEPRRKRLQLTLFEAEPHPVLELLAAVDLSTMTPVEALMCLDSLKRQLSSG